MAEREQSHRHVMDRKQIGLFSRGQWLGFTLGLIAVFIGAYLIQMGKDIGGLGVLITSLSLIVGALLFGSRKPKVVPDEKRDKPDSN